MFTYLLRCVLLCVRNSSCSSCTTGTIHAGYLSGNFGMFVAHFWLYCRCRDLPYAFLEGAFVSIILLTVLCLSKGCPAQPMQPPCNFSTFPFPDLIMKCMVTGRKAVAIKSQRLDLEMQPLGRLIQVRYCHTYVYLHIHIPPYISIFLCQKIYVSVTFWYQIV